MLSPNARSLYTGALTPPPGFVFDEAIGTTFSMDPAMLLSVPVHLAMLGDSHAGETRDGITILEAMRRLSNRITVYAQRGRLQVPSPPHALYGLLETMVIEVVSPRGGVFHPKLWLMRFIDPSNPDSVLLRLMVLSRNLTPDRSWDVALTLEGKPSGRDRTGNQSIGRLIRDLPAMAFGAVQATRQEQAARLSSELRQTEWELPVGFECVRFHVLGLEGGGWRPSRSKRLAVISPFCTDDALQYLVNTSDSAEALITRPETFAELAPESRAGFGCCFALDEAAETEDGEDVEEKSDHDTHGLHAKVYVFEQRWDTHIVLGSANATNAALLGVRNVEVLAELTGKRSRVGSVATMLSADNLGEVLVEITEPDERPDTDPLQQAAETALEAARQVIADANLGIRCTEEDDKGAWNMCLSGVVRHLDGIADALAWPITVGHDHAIDVAKLVDGGRIALGTFAPASLTGLVAFKLRAAAYDQQVRFVLNLPIKGLPVARDAAVLETVVHNRDGFRRYLLLLLGELGYGLPTTDGHRSGNGSTWDPDGPDSMPLLEKLVRAYAREPSRLREVERVVRQLTEGGIKRDIVPREFLKTWDVFQRAMERRNA